MGRNLYILAGALALFALVAVLLSFTGIAHPAGSPPDTALWRTSGVFLLVFALLSALGGVLSNLFEQAERRAEDERQQQRRRRRPVE